jgi:integrase
MRLNEAASLQLEDIDLSAKVLTVRFGKFHRSRLIPLADSSAEILRQYLTVRGQSQAARDGSRYLFPSTQGRKLDTKSIHLTFYRLSRLIGLREPDDNHGPRIHDLRHTFAVESLVRWYESGRDPMLCLPLLSTYLGHVGYEHTYWYLSLCPELMRVSLQKASRYWALGT